MGYSPDAPSVCSLFFAFLDSALCPRRPASVVPSHRLPCPEERMEGRKGRVIYSHLPLRLPAPFQLAEVLSELPSYCPLVSFCHRLIFLQVQLSQGSGITVPHPYAFKPSGGCGFPLFAGSCQIHLPSLKCCSHTCKKFPE